MILAIDHEGWRIARRLADEGIAAFVLKYRVSETPDDERAFGAFSQQRMVEVVRRARAGEPMGFKEVRELAAEDAHSAIQMVRANAVKWRIDPARVGFMGFSAGAATAVDVGIAPAFVDRPDFVAPFYPPLDAEVVPPNAPPMFLAMAFNDEIFGKQKIGIVEAWRQAGRPVEFHGFESGGHGFGLGRAGTSTGLAFDQFLLWMRSRGLLTPAATGAAKQVGASSP
jgi:acetyl esterase/lipase